MSLLISPRYSGASLAQEIEELRLVTMEVSMCHNVARIAWSAMTYQIMEGPGFSEAFQRLNEQHGRLCLSSAKQQQILDLLFNPHTSTSFTIPRNIIGSSLERVADHVFTITSHRSGAPAASPTFVWNSPNPSQIWLSHQAQRSVVAQISAGQMLEAPALRMKGELHGLHRPLR